MCGIAGLLGPGGRAAIRAMTGALAHRGPDGAGYLDEVGRGLHLGHRRLSVIDLATGDQPMSDGDGAVTVVFNGEIYNHRELRAELESLGHRFRTDHSDTEVLVHGWRRWGPDLLPRLNGMFAFAALDRPKNRLVLARDRFGKKPLYWHEAGGLFAFASEATALGRHPRIGLSFDPDALAKLFGYGFLPAPLSAWAGIAKLPAGSWLEKPLDGGAARVETWWRFELAAEPPPGGPDDWAEDLAERLRRAVERRLESDVPLGVLLSGGVDSSAVARFAADARGQAGLDTFAVGFEDESYDESSHARAMAQRLGTRHHEAQVGAAELKAALPEVMQRLDEPFADSSILPTWRVCGHARRHVTVALAGDGGDELFAGYAPFRALKAAALYDRLVPRALRGVGPALARLLPVSDRYMSLDFKLTRTLDGLRHRPALWNPAWLGPLAPDEIADVFHRPVDAEELWSEAISAWDETAGASLVDRTLMFYTRLYLPEDILLKADRASMMHGLELRAPFLDPDVVDLARRLPGEVKLRGNTGKWILKRALDPWLPQDILARPKQGFAVPLAGWLRGMDPAAGGAAVAGLDEGRMAAMWREHRDRRRDRRLPLWCWVALRQAAAGAERDICRHGNG